MKNIAELFNKYHKDNVLNGLGFYKALTEHDKEIISIIDEMIETLESSKYSEMVGAAISLDVSLKERTNVAIALALTGLKERME